MIVNTFESIRAAVLLVLIYRPRVRDVGTLTSVCAKLVVGL